MKFLVSSYTNFLSSHSFFLHRILSVVSFNGTKCILLQFFEFAFIFSSSDIVSMNAIQPDNININIKRK